jgi:membrane dipeptidase
MTEEVRDETFGVYDFGLSVEAEARAARLHEESIVVDMLFQGPCGYRSFTESLLADIEKAAGYTPLERYTAGVFAPVRAALSGEFDEFRLCWERSGITAGNRQIGLPGSLASAQAQFDTFLWLVKALTAGDIRRAKADGIRAGFISAQDISDVGVDRGLENLQVAYDHGLRMLGLSYNVQNAIAGGCMERFDGGVTSLGAELIRRMDALGIIIDMSHSSRRATLDACELSENSIVASHTAVKALNPVDRAKGDEEIEAIAETGGVIGVATARFVAADPGATIETMLDHIDYLSRLVGWQHVAIGTDWPLQIDRQTLLEVYLPMAREFAPAGNSDRAEDWLGNDPDAYLEGFTDYRDFPNITRGLVKRGYTDEQIRGILGENFLRVFETVCG